MRYNVFDYTDAMSALSAARKAGAAVSDADKVTLDRVAGAYLFQDYGPPKEEYWAALKRVRESASGGVKNVY